MINGGDTSDDIGGKQHEQIVAQLRLAKLFKAAQLFMADAEVRVCTTPPKKVKLTHFAQILSFDSSANEWTCAW